MEQTYKAENPLLWKHPRSDRQNTYSDIQSKVNQLKIWKKKKKKKEMGSVSADSHLILRCSAPLTRHVWQPAIRK